MLGRKNLHSGKDRKKRIYSSKYAVSSIVYYFYCGDIFRRTNWLVDKAEREALKLRIAEMRDYLENQIDVIEEYDDSLVRRMIEKSHSLMTILLLNLNQVLA